MRLILTESRLSEVINEIYNFHVGKNHDFQPYKSENKYICDHETGQFGSGTYFSTYSTSDDKTDFTQKYGTDVNKNPNFIQIARNIYRVNFDVYQNMYRVKSEKQGDILHTLLTDLNGFYGRVSGHNLSPNIYDKKNGQYDNAWLYQRIKMNADVLHLKCPDYLHLTRMAERHAQSEHIQSFGTVFMELNGFNGVNVSGVEKFDNTTHGSVIYDLSKVQLNKVEQPQFNQTTTMIAGGSHNNSIGYNLDDEAKSQQAELLAGGRPSWYHFSKMSDKEKTRFVKNIAAAQILLPVNTLEYHLNDYPRLLDFYLKSILKVANRQYSIERYIMHDLYYYAIDNKKYYFINFLPKHSNNNYLISFLDDFAFESISKEERENYLKQLLGYMTRELTQQEYEYIKNDYLNI